MPPTFVDGHLSTWDGVPGPAAVGVRSSQVQGKSLRGTERGVKSGPSNEITASVRRCMSGSLALMSAYELDGPDGALPAPHDDPAPLEHLGLVNRIVRRRDFTVIQVRPALGHSSPSGRPGVDEASRDQ